MKVTGYMLREAIKMHELRRDTHASAFSDTIKKFEDEVKENPVDVVAGFLAAEKAIAKLQTAQMYYNLQVSVEIKVKNTVVEQLYLAEAVKRLGGIARAEKMWRSTASPKSDRYGNRYDDARDKDTIIAKPTITPFEAQRLAQEQGKLAGAFRAAIAVGNAEEIELPIDPALFE